MDMSADRVCLFLLTRFFSKWGLDLDRLSYLKMTFDELLLSTSSCSLCGTFGTTHKRNCTRPEESSLAKEQELFSSRWEVFHLKHRLQSRLVFPSRGSRTSRPSQQRGLVR
ncbi:hypothetical protein MLD38_035773 [Melastoma candidum]|uniref:Uncharacterized protein n=2 Tax=Melastoma candidum TaxID=119954 RepID=A0ACB9LI11_9MYRT|nr:hypothetical protein MLD38_035769 [Melastoma candidum]KAI4310822.1 hypothetical protein MLD38_035773 [Melastoma candidum]